MAPAASGAGVSLVIAYLNGNAVPDLLGWRALLVKWAGTICSVSANLTFGPEAPTVHLGACVAHLATHVVSSESQGFACLLCMHKTLQQAAQCRCSLLLVKRAGTTCSMSAHAAGLRLPGAPECWQRASRTQGCGCRRTVGTGRLLAAEHLLSMNKSATCMCTISFLQLSG